MAGQPSFVPAFQQAIVAYRQGRLAEAAALARETLSANVAHAGALHMLGLIHLRLGEASAAVETFDQLLKLQPDSPDVLNNRALALNDLDRLQDALADLDRAVLLRPTYREALNNRAGLLHALRRYGDAAEAYTRLRTVAPEPKLIGSLLRARMSGCDWTDFEKLSAEIETRVARGEPADEPVSLTWHSLSAALHVRCTEDYVALRYRGPPLPAQASTTRERIRVAYLSCDFREHPISYLLVRLFEQHDRNRFEVLGVSFGLDDKSTMRARVERAFDRFFDVRGQNAREIAELIHREGVDVLVDLAGFTSGNRAQILAYRPAPVQVNFQGFPMGARLVDYTFSDAETAPDRLREVLYREKVVRLPDTWIATDTAQQVASTGSSRSGEGLPATGFVFCSFNTPYKITPAIFDVWMRLLAATEGSVLWLRHDTDTSRDNLRRSAEQRGIAAERLVFATRIGLAEHLARHRLAELFIDTFPYGAHTTATHALWAGLPVLTLRSESFVSRVSASNVIAAGLPELVVESLADYEATALALARAPDRLAALREKLARLRPSAPLFDNQRHRRHVEQAYVEMVARQRRGEAPVSFDVAPLE